MKHQASSKRLFMVLLALIICSGKIKAQPTISSISSYTGISGATINLGGTNFNSTATNNIVYFGATRASVSTASTTSLTVTVPIGAIYQPISILNTSNGLTGCSQYPFLPYYDNSAYLPGVVNFNSPVTFGSTSLKGVAIADLDGDGKTDLIVPDQGNSQVTIYRNISTSGSLTSGSFASGVSFSDVNRPVQIAVGDLDGDGKPDIVAFDSGATISVYRNTSSSGTLNSGSFSSCVSFATQGDPFFSNVAFEPFSEGAIADFDGDGKLDIAVVNFSNNSVSVLQNTAVSGSITTGSFATHVDFTTGSHPGNVAVMDVDGDGKPDMVVGNTGTNTASVLRNTATTGTINSASFATKVDFTTGSKPYVCLGDVDGDGKPELITGNMGNGTVSVLLNTATSGTITSGSFATKVDFSGGLQPFPIKLADIDGDGKPDIVAIPVGGTNLFVFRNTSTTGSITSSSFTGHINTNIINTFYHEIAVGDMDGDGKPDVVIAGTQGVTILRNNPIQPITGTMSVCRGSNTTLSDGTNGGTWSSSNSAVATVGSTGVVTGVGAGTATIRYQLYTSQATATVTVNPLPAITTIGNNGPICTGNTLNLTSTSSGGTGTLAYSWTGPNTFSSTTQNPSILSATISASGVYSLSVTDANSCAATGTNTTTATVNPLPSAITGALTLCQGTITTLSDVTAGGTWISANTGIATIGSSTGVATGVAAGTVVMSYTLSSTGCSSTTTLTINSSTVTGPPVITSVSPNSGFPAASVTITGTNFNASSGNDVVFFGATRATVSLASSTSLTVAVPTGATYNQITVDNTACNLIGSEPYPFLPYYDNSPYVSSALNFDAIVNFTTNTNPQGLVIVDIDGDGRSDLAVVNTGSSNITVYRNISTSGTISTSSFASGINFTTGSGPQTVVSGDIDCDGKPDLAVVNNSSNTVSVFRNTSTSGTITGASLAAKVDFATGSHPIGLALADIDGDGRPDLLITNQTVNTLSVLQNTSVSGSITSGSFASKVDFATGTGPQSIAVTDVDGDGKPDVVVADFGTDSVSVFMNTASTGTINSSSLATQVKFQVRSGPYVVMADIDGDGKQDIITGNNNASNVSVLRNTATSGTIASGSFAVKVDFTASSNPWGVAIGDINGDGKPDIITVNGSANNINVYRNTATSGLINNASLTSIGISEGGGTHPNRVAIGDMDGDGIPDIVLTNNSNSTFSIFRNEPIKPITGATSICTGNATTLSDATSGGTWSSSNIAKATVGSSTGIVTGVASGTVTITYQMVVGKVTMTLTVNQLPAAISGVTSFCQGTSTTLSDATAGGSWYSTNTGVAIAGSVTGILTGVSAGTTIISYTLPTGCSSITTATVNPLPAITAIGNNGPICAVNTLNLTSIASGGTGTLSYAWTGPNTFSATSQNPSIASATTAASGVYSLSITDANGCGATGTNTTTATVNPLPAITAIGNNGPICAGNTLNLTSAASGGTGTLAYSWAGPNTFSSTSQNPSISSATTAASGIYSLSVTDANGCGTTGTNTTTATVNPLPSITAIGNNGPICVGNTLNLNSTSSGGTGVLAYLWSGPNTFSSTIQNPSITSSTTTASGVYSLTVTDANNCRAANTTLATVNPLPGAISGISSVCAGTSITMSDAGGGTWASSNSSIAIVGSSSGIVTGISNGIATITYTLSTGCIATKTITVVGSLTVTGIKTVCVGSTTTLSNSSPGGLWTSGNTAKATVNCDLGIVTGIAAGTAVISYSIGSGCTVTTTIAVIAISPITGSTGVCAGYNTQLSNTYPGGIWSCSDLTKAIIDSASGVVTGVSNGNATISYSFGPSCMTQTGITVLSLGANTCSGNVCVGATSTISNVTASGTWSSSNTAVASVVSSSGVVTGVSAGSAVITYKFGSNCYSLTTVTINPVPGSVSVSGSGTYCGGTPIIASGGTGGTIYFQGNTSGGTSMATPYSSQSITLSGTYYFRAQSSEGCWGTEGSAAVVVPAITGTQTICTGGTTTLQNSGGTGGRWTSSDSTIATINATTGVASGIRTGSVIITDSLSSGCVVTTTLTVGTAAPGISGPVSVCRGQTITLTNAGIGGTWSSGATTVATVNLTTGIVTGIASGLAATITYTLGSCRAIYTVTVNALSAIPNVGTNTLCTGQTLTLTNPTPGGTWSSSSSTISIGGTTGIITGISTGPGLVSYTMPTGCMTTTTVKVRVLSPIVGPGRVCVGQSITLTDTAVGGTWSCLGTSATIASVNGNNGIITGVAGGLTATVTYTLGSGCVATARIGIDSLQILSGPTNVCQGQSITLNGGIINGTWSSSSSSIATAGSSGAITGIITGTGSGVALISYRLPSGCTATKPVIVNPTNGITGPASVCLGQTIALSEAAYAGTWSSSAPTIATVGSTGIVTGIAANRTAIITYNFCSGCTATYTITVNPMSAIAGAASVCQGQLITLTDATTGGTWSSSSPGIASIVATNGNTTGIATGVATISYVLSTGCTATKLVTVNPLSPIAGPTSVCYTGSITLSDAIAGGTWYTATPTIASVVTGTGVVTGVTASASSLGSIITYTTPLGCKATYIVSVNALPATPAAIGGPSTVSISGAHITLTDATTGGTWSSSNTARATVVASSGVVTGVGLGSVIITYTVTNASGCSNIVTKNISVGPLPPTHNSIYNSARLLVGSSILVNEAGSGGEWNCLDCGGIISINEQTGFVTGIEPGRATISYTVINDTGASTTITDVTVNAKPEIVNTVNEKNVGIMVIPNPNNGEFLLKGTLTNAPTEANIEITDMLGQVIYNTLLTSANGIINERILLNNSLASGTYILHVYSAKINTTVQFVIEK